MENKKLTEQLKATLMGLTDEQKEKVKACKDSSELASLLVELGVELPDEMLDTVAGGLKYHEDGTRYDPGNMLDLLEYYAESDRRAKADNVHPTDRARVAAIDKEVFHEFFED